LLRPAQPQTVAGFGLFDLRAQAELPSALRTDTPRAIRLWALVAAV
jgi:hypothetical protein